MVELAAYQNIKEEGNIRVSSSSDNNQNKGSEQEFQMDELEYHMSDIDESESVTDSNSLPFAAAPGHLNGLGNG